MTTQFPLSGPMSVGDLLAVPFASTGRALASSC